MNVPLVIQGRCSVSDDVNSKAFQALEAAGWDRTKIRGVPNLSIDATDWGVVYWTLVFVPAEEVA